MFHTGVGIVNGFDKFFVVTDETQFSSRDVDVVKHQTVKVILLDFHLQGYGSPDVVGVAATADGGKRLFRRTVLHMELWVVFLFQAEGNIIVVLYHDGVIVFDLRNQP